MILTGIPGTAFQLDAPAEASWERMEADGNPAGITTAYRDAAYQLYLYNLYLSGRGSFALPPGKSKHELGLAVDVDLMTANWMVSYGAAYGWARSIGWDASSIPVGKREWWHFEYQASNDTHATPSTSPISTPINPRKKAKMLHFYIPDTASPRGVKYIILMPDGRRCDYTSGDSAFPNAIAANIGNAVLTDEGLITALQTQLRASGPPSAPATIDPAAIKAAMPTAAQIAALVPAPADNSDSIVTKVITAFKNLSWSAK